MSEYIEREAAKEAIGFINLHFVACGEEKSLLDVINEIPAADAVPVVHGRWLYKRCVVFDFTKDAYRCSECNTTWDAESNYCPNCGARMDGDTDG